ncbi:serine/threonine-protein kinase [Polyangium sp. y55x31]|uniref:serine/threonine-protein kinase n=1 Tax=Polyangium sp. y55x31 TaxID=3042688 RepID=UPI0024828780|nr:serine/threonine-protein kinase [Polyangium sp. y55x31]MDI1479849.1 serine/threonine-protein kinase [Polyangium sp. y55x31]
MPAPFVPELFGDFLLVQRIARRAMSDVLVAVRLGDRSGQTFVLKRPVLGERASGRAAQAIQREGEVLAEVRASALPALSARGELAGLPYVAIEHVRGAPLDELAPGAEPMPEGAARAVALDVARALAALHEKGWVHGDLAASNVMIDETGEAKLVDLGLARRAGEARPEVAGTPGYLAPEAALPGEASPASDVYGWAVVVAECALGRRIFPEDDLASAGARGDPPRALAAWEARIPGLAAALAREASRRPTSASIAAGLEALALDREALAARVEAHRARASEERTALARLPAPEARGLSEKTPPPALAEPAREPEPEPEPAPSPRPAPPPRRSVGIYLAVALGAVLLFAMGQFSARLPPRNPRGSVSLAGVVPRRAHVEVDGEKVALPADGRLELRSGDHTVAVVLAKGGRREYTFRVRPNEHVVLVAPKKGATNNDDEEAEEREP